MTTMELIEKHGIGANCLSDAYDLGVKQGRADAIDEFLSHLLDAVEFFSLEDEIKIRNLFIGIAEQIKE